ncbi:MarR family winged helix-turn-helix transcriptional regulator [Hyphobacterium marinum]|uniref:MarR family transcriptional regulator n=1 Tax=Hyphobacterium marinum TaxID=3116574 RepID=A0ABU7LZK9_9PROT|nr:MarR family transcriptional regulator [Hyphobacterium sp. Y6023]MEE2566993.1 MarR family transcriptional regulator [Hyphobacterium sp. Y6023]
MPDATETKARLSLPDYLPYRLSVASNQVSGLIARAYQDRFGLTIWEWRVVAVLGEAEPQTAQGLVEATAMDKVTVSRAVRSLAGKGHVARSRHHSDGRSAMIRLTPPGRAMYDDIAPAALKLERDLLDGFGKSEIARFMGMLAELESRAGTLAET